MISFLICSVFLRRGKIIIDLIGLFVCWLFDELINWLIHWLIDWFNDGWLNHFMVDWLVGIFGSLTADFLLDNSLDHIHIMSSFIFVQIFSCSLNLSTRNKINDHRKSSLLKKWRLVNQWLNIEHLLSFMHCLKMTHNPV